MSASSMTSFPSGMQLYSMAGPEGTPADIGRGTASQIDAGRMTAQQHFAPPAVQHETQTVPTTGESIRSANPAMNYSDRAPLPAKYAVPTPMKEEMEARQQIRQAAGASLRESGNVVRTDPISDSEIAYYQMMKQQGELADFDRYVATLFDFRKPGELQRIMSIYPEYVNRRISQVHTDHEFALRNYMISAYGINTKEDLFFRYLVDQGKISGPQLQKTVSAGNAYHTGWLSPFMNFGTDRTRNAKLQLPYAGAVEGVGPRPENPIIDDNVGGTLTRGRGAQTLANQIYAPTNGAMNIMQQRSGIPTA